MSPAREPSFGLFLVPNAAEYPDLVRQAEAAERAGLDLIGIQDHPYQRRHLDTFALIGDLLARTVRIRIFSDVANLPLRHPALLANLAASLDVMSGGRFELGLGAGAFWDGVAAMGGPRRSGGESVDALEEAIGILRRSWKGERSITHAGRHYELTGFHPGPPPAHDIGIWVGAYKPRMLELTGRLADGWVPSSGGAPPEAIPEMAKRIDDAAAQAGRDPREIRRLYNVKGVIADGPVRERFHGPPGHWVELLTELHRERGLDSFVFWPYEGDVTGQVERFAQEVAPGVREAAPD